ncbi:MAG: protease [Gammaproteobacteria bacterium SG8_11]|nr:MAG: protease [Gammaproteobacteria bacterium SG8_11]
MASHCELLSPAGSLKHMRYAFAYGADAVYAGQPRYSLRVRNNSFDMENLAIGITEAHRLGKRFYVASNIMPHNSKVKTYLADMEPVIAMQPDALIMADPGLIMLIRDKWPDVPVHLSVQANTVNYAAVKFWQSLGLSRVILSRELSLDEIEEIRQRCPDIELEVFVHGALCIAYSGRCLLSGYFNHRDPNQGTCTNACRWQYKVHDAQEDDSGNIQKIDFNAMHAIQNPELFAEPENRRHPLADKVYLIEEQERSGQFMPIMEDEHGTYIMNSKDLRAVQHVERLVNMGIDCLKIEGRTKSYYYAARTAQIYRQAMDDAAAGNAFNPGLYKALEGLANRGYTEGFYQRHPDQNYQNYLDNYSRSTQQRFVGEISAFDTERGMAEVQVKNRFAVGDRLQVLSPNGNSVIVLETIESDTGAPMEVAPGGGYVVRIPLPPGNYDNGLLAQIME